MHVQQGGMAWSRVLGISGAPADRQTSTMITNHAQSQCALALPWGAWPRGDPLARLPLGTCRAPLPSPPFPSAAPAPLVDQKGTARSLFLPYPVQWTVTVWPRCGVGPVPCRQAEGGHAQRWDFQRYKRRAGAPSPLRGPHLAQDGLGEAHCEKECATTGATAGDPLVWGLGRKEEIAADHGSVAPVARFACFSSTLNLQQSC